jgi:hypothetical protein
MSYRLKPQIIYLFNTLQMNKAIITFGIEANEKFETLMCNERSDYPVVKIDFNTLIKHISTNSVHKVIPIKAGAIFIDKVTSLNSLAALFNAISEGLWVDKKLVNFKLVVNGAIINNSTVISAIVANPSFCDRFEIR